MFCIPPQRIPVRFMNACRKYQTFHFPLWTLFMKVNESVNRCTDLQGRGQGRDGSSPDDGHRSGRNWRHRDVSVWRPRDAAGRPNDDVKVEGGVPGNGVLQVTNGVLIVYKNNLCYLFNLLINLIICSTPAPGYFNDDDVLDFMVHWSSGAWPTYNSSKVTITITIHYYWY